MNDSQPWYRDGLRFQCTRCGNCCGGEPGWVHVSEEEIASLAGRLRMGVDEFRRRYVRDAPGGGSSLKEKSNYDCVFYDRSQGCTVYSHRPRQCRTWPFWGKIIASRRKWRRAGRTCPGIGCGRRHSAREIEAAAAADGLREQ